MHLLPIRTQSSSQIHFVVSHKLRDGKRTFTSQFIPQIWVPPGHFWIVRYRYRDQRWPTLGTYDTGRISAEYLNDEDASCNTFKEKAIPTYLHPTNLRVKWNWPPSGGFVCRTLNVTVLWTWDDSDIYNIGGLKLIRHIRIAGYSVTYINVWQSRPTVIKSTMRTDDGHWVIDCYISCWKDQTVFDLSYLSLPEFINSWGM